MTSLEEHHLPSVFPSSRRDHPSLFVHGSGLSQKGNATRLVVPSVALVDSTANGAGHSTEGQAPVHGRVFAMSSEQPSHSAASSVLEDVSAGDVSSTVVSEDIDVPLTSPSTDIPSPTTPSPTTPPTPSPTTPTTPSPTTPPPSPTPSTTTPAPRKRLIPPRPSRFGSPAQWDAFFADFARSQRRLRNSTQKVVYLKRGTTGIAGQMVGVCDALAVAAMTHRALQCNARPSLFSSRQRRPHRPVLRFPARRRLPSRQPVAPYRRNAPLP